MTNAILKQIDLLGYQVWISRGHGYTRLSARPDDGGVRYVVQYLDGDSEDDLYRAACTLAQAVGIDLEDG